MKEEAKRIQSIPPYLFARIEKKIEEAKEKGVDIISLGIGDPDCPTPDFVIDEMAKEIYNTENHQYPSSVGMLACRQAVADWYEKTFWGDIRPENGSMYVDRLQRRDRQHQLLLCESRRYQPGARPLLSGLRHRARCWPAEIRICCR